MKASTLFKQVAIGVGVSAALVGTAMADPILSFDYTQEFEFVGALPAAAVTAEGTTNTLDNVAGNTKLSWGTGHPSGNNRLSSLVINPEAGDNTSPSGDLTQGTLAVSTSVNAVTFGLGPTVVHNNFVITGTSLDSTEAHDNVILSPVGGGPDQAQNITFGIDFQETPNNPNDPGACPAGVVFTDGLGCGDIFALSGGLLGAPTSLNNDTILAFLIDSFVIDGYIYDVFVTAPGLGVLSDAACVAVSGPGSENCIGFTTFENQENSFTLEFAIVANPVPEPATIALLAGSLLLMSLVRRKKVGSLSA